MKVGQISLNVLLKQISVKSDNDGIAILFDPNLSDLPEEAVAGILAMVTREHVRRNGADKTIEDITTLVTTPNRIKDMRIDTREQLEEIFGSDNEEEDDEAD